MSPYCSDAEKYKIVDIVTQKFKEFFEKKTKITGKLISEIITINGIRFTLENGSWGLIRASSNKPSFKSLFLSWSKANCRFPMPAGSIC